MSNDPLSRLALYAYIALCALFILSPALDLPIANLVRLTREVSGVQAWSEAAYNLGLGWVLITLCVLIWVWAKRSGRPYHLRTAWVGALAVAVSGLATQVIKHLIGRPRPRMNLPPHMFTGYNLDSDFHSMPSGHTATCFALAVILSARFPRYSWLFYGLSAGVGIGRVLAGSHYLSDVMAAAILGLLVGLALKRLLLRNAVN